MFYNKKWEIWRQSEVKCLYKHVNIQLYVLYISYIVCVFETYHINFTPNKFQIIIIHKEETFT